MDLPINAQPARLIVNADDYGYFEHVSQGILDCVAAGSVTATGVMANGQVLERCSEMLLRCDEIDVGVHLNATLGRPLTAELRRVLRGTADAMPAKGTFAVSVLSGRMPIAAIEAEWRAQIEKCRSLGFRLRFLNSHEHVHMLPPLYGLALRLAREYGIRHVRRTRPEWDWEAGVSGVARSLAIAAMAPFCDSHGGGKEPHLLGLAPSGRLHEPYVQRSLENLRAGEVYELMCHPGRAPGPGPLEERLRLYHDWEGELAVLNNPSFRGQAAAHGIELIGFRDLQ